MPKKLRPSGGYRKTVSFQTATIIYDATYWFCEKYLHPRSRTVDQMVQAARSGRQNFGEGNDMSVHYEKRIVIKDARGVVFEPVSEDALSDKKNAHVVISGPGVIRGNHYHKNSEETMAVMGPALVRVRDDTAIRDITVLEGEAYTFVFAPGQSHAIKNLSSNINILVAFSTAVHDREHPDTEVDVLL